MNTHFSRKIIITSIFILVFASLVSSFTLPKRASAATTCPPLSGALDLNLPSAIPSDWCSYVCPQVFPQYLLEKDQEAAQKDISGTENGTFTCGTISGPTGNASQYWPEYGRGVDQAKNAFVTAINNYVRHSGYPYAQQVTTDDLSDTWCIPCDKHLLAKVAEPIDTDQYTYQCSDQLHTMFRGNTLPDFINPLKSGVAVPTDWCRACFIDSNQFANDSSGGTCKSSNAFSEEIDRIAKSRGILSHGRSDFVKNLEDAMKGDGSGVSSHGWCRPCIVGTSRTKSQEVSPGGEIISTTPLSTPSTDDGTFDPLRNPLGEGGIYTISDLIARILSIISTIAIPFAVLAVLWSGFLFIKAQGNPDEIKKASMTLLFTVLGTALLFAGPKLATAIADTVKDIFQDDLSSIPTTTYIASLPGSRDATRISS